MKITDIEKFNQIFKQAISDYHINDDINQEIKNPYEKNSLEWLLYEKCFVDTIQWHLEDIIRKPDIDPSEALKIKRRIDALNQKRTDLVEFIDDFIYDKVKNIKPMENARMNTESPGWAIDRLSILNLKIYHWEEEVNRPDATDGHIKKAQNKLNILYAQFQYLSTAIKQLIQDMQKGLAIAQTYKQMKMYNDPELNPVLRQYKKKNR